MHKALFLALSGLGIAFAGMTPATATPRPEPARSPFSTHAVPPAGSALVGHAQSATRTPGPRGVLPTGTPARSSHHALTPRDCAYAVNGRFVERWTKFSWQYGCPVADASPSGNGIIQYFTNGAIIWSPDQGNDMIASAFRMNGHDLYFQWGWSEPFTYNDWLFHAKRDGQEAFQDECNTDKRHCNPLYSDGGEIGWSALGPGNYTIQVEGCDLRWSGHYCHQGWTLSVPLRLPY
jgi:hypothetical protein